MSDWADLGIVRKLPRIGFIPIRGRWLNTTAISHTPWIGSIPIYSVCEISIALRHLHG